MIIIEPSVTLLGHTTLASGFRCSLGYVEEATDPALLLERAGRTAWKSEGKAGPGTSAGFCERVLRNKGHESVAEHASATMLFVTDRIVSHQLVRHRIAAYTQESTHYLNYSKDAFDRQIRVCKPWDLPNEGPAFDRWKKAMEDAEESYFSLIEDHKQKHYAARYALPMGLKTELCATYNFRTWKHVIRLRTEINSSGRIVNTPEVHYLMLKAQEILRGLCPEVFQ